MSHFIDEETTAQGEVKGLPLEKEKATHSSILAQRIPWTVHGVTKSWTRLSDFHFYFHFTTWSSDERDKTDSIMDLMRRHCFP